MKVHWTDRSVRHLVAIHDYIAQDSPSYATRVIDRLTRRSEQLGRHPLSGRRVPEFDREDVREVIERPYRLIYRVKADQIDVIAVVHGARRLPNDVT